LNWTEFEAEVKALIPHISTSHLEQLKKFQGLLIEKSSIMNLISKEALAHVLEDHFYDSLTAVTFLKSEQIKKGIDLGSGGGFPGVILQVVLEDAEITLVDSTGKKADFLKEVCQSLSLRPAQVFGQRVEVLAHHPDHRGAYDFVTCRAVDKINILLEYAAGFLKLGGKAVFWKSENVDAEIKASNSAQKKMGMKYRQNLETSHHNKKRSLVIFEKISETDSQFPRETGTPKKFPFY